jgi:hypothetical protein
MVSGALVLSINGEPLIKMSELFTNKEYREHLLTQVEDQAVVDFFHHRFDKWGREQPLMLESTLRRVYLLTFSPVLRNSLGQHESWLDFRRFIDEGTSVIFDLGGVTDPDARRLIGCLISVGYETAALSRADISGGTTARGQYHLILDEFAEFVSQSDEALSRVLSQCRKFGLFLTLSHQTHSQSSERLRGALGNCGCHVYFKLSRSDAEVTARSLGSVDPYTVKDEAHTDTQHALYLGLSEQWEAWTQAVSDGLGKRQAYVKTFDRRATLIRTLDVPDASVPQERLDEVLDHYSQLYQRSTHEIERLRAAREGGSTRRQEEHVTWQTGGDEDVA